MIERDLDIAVLPELEQWLAGIDGHCEIDLSTVTFFDSSALRTFLKGRRLNPRLRIVQPSAAVFKVLVVTGTVEHLIET